MKKILLKNRRHLYEPNSLQKLFASHIGFTNVLIDYLNRNFIQTECYRSNEFLFSKYVDNKNQQATCSKSTQKNGPDLFGDDLFLIQFFNKTDVLFVDKNLYESYGRSLLETDRSSDFQDSAVLIDHKVILFFLRNFLL
jgi:hypothetical protein